MNQRLSGTANLFTQYAEISLIEETEFDLAKEREWSVTVFFEQNFHAVIGSTRTYK